MTERQAPPFDGKPCPVCPVNIRHLFAAAANLAQAVLRGDEHRYESKARELRAAVEELQPLVDAHFADPRHSTGTPPADHPAADDQA